MTESDVKEAVRKRDGHRCLKCGVSQDDHRATEGRGLDVHRTVPGSGYSLAPGVCETLCRKCHGSATRSPRGDVSGLARDVGAAVRAARSAAGVAQKDLAAVVGIRNTHLSRMERGRHLVSILSLLRIEEALRLPICSLLDPPRPVGDESSPAKKGKK
ncbi:helix-turn-helix domain-containing protein [Fimbriiglobus ruber]|uniref:helix-turn-helix domain-containing protein n=1 Tax=Fimbriiglobus ruber TaxID=1908690 RepID=UPI000B4ADCFA